MTSKEKSFIGVLAGISIACIGGLYFWASKGASRYDEAKDKFATVSADIARMTKMSPSPTAENLAGKSKALTEYKSSATELAAKLNAFRPEALTSTDPQTFTDTLVKVAGESKKAYEDIGLKAEGENSGIPKTFYLGFEAYTDTQAKGEATGLLAYELGAISELHASLAAAKPHRLLNFHRETLAEESGKAYVPTPGLPYRVMPIEVAFSGSEKSLREFVNSLQTSKKHFYLVRSMRILNEKQSAPKASDVQFGKASAASGAGAAPAGGIFDTAFVLPGEEPAKKAPAPETPPASAPGATPAPAPAPKSNDTGKILEQVLGSENIEVFLRIDILLFADEAKAEVPKKRTPRPN
jgi:hypothetical protein